MNNRRSLATFWLLAALTLAAASHKPRWQQSVGSSILTFDVCGYYSYLPAFFIYHDLKTMAWLQPVLEKYQIAGGQVNTVVAPKTGNPVIKYACGEAVLYSPFFLAAHFLARPLGFEADGFSKPYQFAIAFGGLTMALLGLYFSRKILLRFFSDRTTAATLVALALGTNWHHYARFDYGHTHIWLFAIYAGLIWQTILFYEKTAEKRPVFWNSLAIGSCLGLAILTRPTEMIAILIPLFWNLKQPFFGKNGGLAERLFFFKTHWASLVVAAAATIFIGSIQLLYWKMVAGQWLFYSYNDQTFSFLHPHLLDGLISYRKGWLIYTPMMGFAIAGFWFLWKNRPTLFWPTALFSILNIWIVFSWDIWWYGGSFGQRAMIQGYAVLILPLAAWFEFGLKTTLRKLIFLTAMGFCLFLNLFQSWQGDLTGMSLDSENTTEAFYWRMFLRFKPDMNDQKLLDGHDDFGNLDREGVKTLFENDFENETDSTIFSQKFKNSGQKSIVCDGRREYVPIISGLKITDPTARWLRVSARFFVEMKEFETWKSSALVLVAADANGQPLRDAYHKPMRYLEIWHWKDLFFDLQLPQNKRFDHVDIYFWQPTKGSKAIFMDDVRVESFH